MSSRDRAPLLLAGLLLCVTACVGAESSGRGATPAVGSVTPFSSIVSGNPADYKHYLFKLTYMGPESKGVKTAVFGSASVVSPAVFAPYRRAGYRYENDDQGEFVKFSVSASNVNAIIDSLSHDPVLTDPRDRPTPVLSLMIMRDVGGPDEQVFESLVQFPDAARLVRDVIGSHLDPANVEGAKIIRYWLKNVGG